MMLMDQFTESRHLKKPPSFYQEGRDLHAAVANWGHLELETETESPKARTGTEL